MREPYETLLGQYRDHWLFGPYLRGDEPDWSGLAGDPRLDGLSTGEKVLLDFAAAYRNTRLYLDDDQCYRVALAMSREAAEVIFGPAS